MIGWCAALNISDKHHLSHMVKVAGKVMGVLQTT